MTSRDRLSIVAYILKARPVKTETAVARQRLVTRNDLLTVGSHVFCNVRAEALVKLMTVHIKQAACHGSREV